MPTDDPIFYTISERHDQRPAAEMLRIIELQMSEMAEPIRTSDPQYASCTKSYISIFCPLHRLLRSTLLVLVIWLSFISHG